MKTKQKKRLHLLPWNLAWDRCRTCDKLGRGKHAGNCIGRRGDNGKYMPIQQVYCCPTGRQIGDKAEVNV